MSPVARAILPAVAAVGLVAAAPPLAATADDDVQVWVSAYGAAFPPSQADTSGMVEYRVRGHDRGPTVRLTEPIHDDAGWVPFSGAADALPGGYCVSWVRVPGVGTWQDSSASVCTPRSSDDDPAPSPSPSETTPAPDPAPTATDTPSTPSASPTSSPGPTATPEPSVSPTPSATPSPSPSAGPSPTASGSPSATPSPATSASSVAVAQGRGLLDSFTRDDAPARESDVAAGTADDGPGGTVWRAAAGLLVAAGAVAAGAVALWRAWRRSG
ncbi:hypothetical protein [Isoptericola hypogeus]|uniref:hypothetical protein n=1 Tax=Isoptericola hypogeus TaxID=300179 RepID=UPI0031D1BECA